MKKTILLSAFLALGMSAAFAQTDEEPNRLILHSPGEQGRTESHVLSRVDRISFDIIEGEVVAPIQIENVSASEITASVIRSEACDGFIIDVMPRVIAAQLKDPVSMIAYMRTRTSTVYYEDFEHGKMTGMELTPGGDYSAVTVGIDRLGTYVGVSRADFTVKGNPVQGSPKVEASLVGEPTTRSFTVKFVPNADVSSYYTVAGEKGEMMSNYEQFGAMMGATSFAQYLQKLGIEKKGTSTNEWKDMDPGVEYEVYIQPLDKAGNFADYTIFNVKTVAIGGDGAAVVQITPGKYVMAQWGEEMMPSQFFTFTPNDQTAAYRFGVYTEEQYEAKKEDIKKDLCSEPPMPNMANWFFFEPLTTDFQIDQNTKVVAIAAGKNSKNEWGEVTELRYTTPAEVGGSAQPGAAPAFAPVAPSTVVLEAQPVTSDGIRARKSATRLPGNGYAPKAAARILRLAH